ncbi:MAG: hypothetical protein KBA03_02450 [Anaerolineaceae bacterium]|nr:hypothetical protein [Anaerolineaceae bacterium]
MKDKSKLRLRIAQFLIFVVLVINIFCAVDFIVRPDLYKGGYELSGEVGRVVVIGYGILFLMWQVPYFFALAQPVIHRTSLIQAILMQTIGLIGESFLLRSIPIEHEILRGSILRFIIFDAGGLVLLLLAVLVVRKDQQTKIDRLR